MIDIYKRSLKSEKLVRLEEPERGSWISITGPSQAELEGVAEKFGLDKKTLTDALDDNEYPRMEVEDGKSYIIIRVPTEENGIVTTEPFLIVLTEEHIVSLSKDSLKLVEQIVEHRDDFFTTQKVKFMIQVFMQTSEIYERYLNRIAKDIRSKKCRLKSLTDDDIMRLVENEEVLNDFNSSFHPTVRMFNRLLDGKHLPLYRNDRDLISDLIINSQQTLEMCDANLRTISNIREAYSAVLTNTLNKRIKVLTVMTIALTFPTVIASLFGMNVVLPMQGYRYVFILILVAIAAVLVIFMLISRWRRWI
jgi:magnesium transporter